MIGKRGRPVPRYPLGRGDIEVGQESRDGRCEAILDQPRRRHVQLRQCLDVAQACRRRERLRLPQGADGPGDPLEQLGGGERLWPAWRGAGSLVLGRPQRERQGAAVDDPARTDEGVPGAVHDHLGGLGRHDGGPRDAGERRPPPGVAPRACGGFEPGQTRGIDRDPGAEPAARQLRHDPLVDRDHHEDRAADQRRHQNCQTAVPTAQARERRRGRRTEHLVDHGDQHGVQLGQNHEQDSCRSRPGDGDAGPRGPTRRHQQRHGDDDPDRRQRRVRPGEVGQQYEKRGVADLAPGPRRDRLTQHRARVQTRRRRHGASGFDEVLPDRRVREGPVEVRRGAQVARRGIRGGRPSGRCRTWGRYEPLRRPLRRSRRGGHSGGRFALQLSLAPTAVPVVRAVRAAAVPAPQPTVGRRVRRHRPLRGRTHRSPPASCRGGHTITRGPIRSGS